MLILSACSTNYAAHCEPPSHVLVPALALPKVEGEGMPLDVALKIWLDDMNAYAVLAERHNRLVAWIETRC